MVSFNERLTLGQIQTYTSVHLNGKCDGEYSFRLLKNGEYHMLYQWSTSIWNNFCHDILRKVSEYFVHTRIFKFAPEQELITENAQEAQASSLKFKRGLEMTENVISISPFISEFQRQRHFFSFFLPMELFCRRRKIAVRF